MARVIIDTDRCKGCKLCTYVCPKKLLQESDTLNIRGVYPTKPTDPTACIGCLQCVLMCPDAVITIEEDELETGGEK
jgi:2-oxoglutarate ferredoxin oxidoreductase subunit delta